jgi:phosphatidyl-myo-inositol dimannoside synthase
VGKARVLTIYNLIMKILALLTDAYGERGGIAKFNRDMLASTVSMDEVESVDVLVRGIVEDHSEIPDKINFHPESAGSLARYASSVARLGVRGGWDAVICGHINLVPFARAVALRSGAPILLILHGVDAWEPTGRRSVDRLVRGVDAFVAVSDFTRQRFSAWSHVPTERGIVVPNCIDRSKYGPGERPEYLLERYGLHDQKVLITVGRISSLERYKGFDEVLDVLPDLAEEIPNIAYLVVGDGDDRKRLQRKAHNIGMGDRVRFAGYIPEEEKADHYRLADTFVMPGYGEGFGIVYLESLACGIPVVASSRDASQEAVLGGELGEIVDPSDREDLKEGIRRALARGRGVPDRLSYFDFERFKERWKDVVSTVFVRGSTL